MIERFVWCTLQFAAFHRWPEARGIYAYLASLHRHVFHVKVTWKVTHGDREIEFIEAKRKVQWFIDTAIAGEYQPSEELGLPRSLENFSCEHWAQFILVRFDAHEVTVSEDNENGAVVRRI